MRTRKIVFMMVKASVPIDMTAKEARREVKTLISHQCNWAADPEDVKALAVRPTGRKRARK